ncbi:hypothetical protein ABVK25_002363 [Lepraria finkii]|uniref:non-specific serine/threonine protein kinase n=1 Tax=Lepraria finkii TaxID=1340010 RepID=A0ABR4BHU7_9LECA
MQTDGINQRILLFFGRENKCQNIGKDTARLTPITTRQRSNGRPATTSKPHSPPFTHTHPAPTLLTQGAEALLYYRTDFLTPSHPCALKYRPSKPYRHPTLDKRLTRHRILSEARTLVKCRREGVSVPGVLALDAEGDGVSGGWMMMEWVEGKTIREVLVAGAKRRKEGRDDRDGWEEGAKVLMGKVGRGGGEDA